MPRSDPLGEFWKATWKRDAPTNVITQRRPSREAVIASPLIRKSHRWLPAGILEWESSGLQRVLPRMAAQSRAIGHITTGASWFERDHWLFQIDDPIHVISIDETSSTSSRQKPPDYETVTDAPPSYDDAIKLNPSQLFSLSNGSTASSLSSGQIIPTSISIVSPTLAPPPPYAR